MDPKTHLQMLQDVRRVYQDEDYAAALPMFEALVKVAPDDGQLWVSLLDCYFETEQWQKFIEVFEHVERLGSKFYFPFLLFLKAIAHAHLDRRNEAIETLRRAVQLGLRDRRRPLNHEVFDAYQNDAEFREIVGLLPRDREFSREDGWRYDLEYYRGEVLRLHPNGRSVAESKAFQDQYQLLHDNVPALTDAQLFMGFMRMQVLLNDGHTTIYPVSEGELTFTQLPVYLYFFDDELAILGSDDKSLIGASVTHIGGVPVSGIMEKLPDVVPQDNPQTVKWIGPTFLTVPTFLMEFGAAQHPDRASLTLRMPDGETKTVELEGGEFQYLRRFPAPPDINPPHYLQHPDRNIWKKSLPELDALYVQFSQVRNHEDNSLRDFADELKGEIQAEGFKNLIIDVRLNNGGNNTLLFPLLRTLVFFEQLNDEHQLYVITGRNTFSACQNFVNRLDRLCNPIFVGEPTGSRPNFIGESTNLHLPYSGLKGSISCFLWQDSVTWDNRIWIAPHVPVTLTREDYFNGHDPCLAAIEALVS